MTNVGLLRWRNNCPISSNHPQSMTRLLSSPLQSQCLEQHTPVNMSALTSPERTPLLAKSDDRKEGFFSPLRRVLFTAFVSATSFAFTQTSLIYAFRVMTCDDYFDSRLGDLSHGGDRCSTPAIESRTAKAIAVMSTMTTFCCTSSIPPFLMVETILYAIR